MCAFCILILNSDLHPPFIDHLTYHVRTVYRCNWFSVHRGGGPAWHSPYGLRPCDERGPSISLCLSLASRPCNCTEMHPATRELERVYNESSSNSRVDGSRFRLALSNDPPLSCHSTPLGLSLITSLSSRYLLLSSQPSLPRLPPSSTTSPVRAASGVTLNSGPAAMCPTTRANVDKARHH